MSLVDLVREMKIKAVRAKVPVPLERNEAITLTDWVKAQGLGRWWIMIPNASKLAGNPGQRAAMVAKMKRQGFYVGASDYFLAMPQRGYHGLWLELKRQRGGSTTPEQKQFQLEMASMGYAVAICKGFEEARQAINDYFGANWAARVKGGEREQA